MTKEEFLKELIDAKVKIMYKLRRGDCKLIKECGGKVNCSLKELKVKTQEEITERALKIAKRVDWKLLETDEEAFKSIFNDKYSKQALRDIYR